MDAVVVSFAPGTAVRAAGAVLFLGACAVLALVGVVAWRASPRSRTRRPDPVDCARLRAEADALAAHAASVARASSASAVAAAGAASRAAAAAAARDAAWTAYEAADRSHADALRDAVAGRPAVAEPPERRHDVSRAALAAYRRGAISVEELREVWRRAGGWDPAQERRERDAEHLAGERSRARRTYERAAALARERGRAAEVAEVAARALADEAAEAATEAWDARQAADDCARRAAGPFTRWRRR